jgi:hypothetical protein
MATTIEIRGLKGSKVVQKELGELPMWLGRLGAAGELAARIQQRAKHRCPKWSRKLWNSIRTRPVGEFGIQVDMGLDPFVPYAGFQEFGFSEHSIAGSWSNRGNRKVADWMNQKLGMARNQAMGKGISVGKPKSERGYIIGSAFYSTEKDIIPILDKFCKKRLNQIQSQTRGGR